MTPESFTLIRKIIDTAIENGMEVDPDTIQKFRSTIDNYTVEKMTVDDVSEKLDAALNRPVVVTVVNDNKDLIAALEKLLNRPNPTPIITLNAPPNPPVVVNAQVMMPETVETINLDRDANGYIVSAKKTRKKKVE